jgi:serine/threonine-protein kinase
MPNAAPTRITPASVQAPPAPAHQSVLDRSSSPPRSSVLPWAIAAILLIAVAGSAFAFRDRLFGQSNVQPTAATTTPAVNTVAPSNAVAATTTPGSATSTSSPSTTSAAADPNANAATTNVASTQDNSAATAASNAAATSTTTDASADTSGAPAARASQAGVEALRDLPAAQAAENAPAPRIANATPEKPAAPPKPHVPTVAVIASGDNVIASPAEEAVVSLLQSRGFRVIEGGRAHGDRPNLGAMSGKADAVVFVNARPVGTQEIAYYGQSSTLYTVQLGVKAYRVADGSVVWTSSAEQVNFTSLNAAEKAREAIEPMLDSVDSRLAEFRSRGGRG